MPDRGAISSELLSFEPVYLAVDELPGLPVAPPP
jgi:hypothetical protein